MAGKAKASMSHLIADERVDVHCAGVEIRFVTGIRVELGVGTGVEMRIGRGGGGNV